MLLDPELPLPIEEPDGLVELLEPLLLGLELLLEPLPLVLDELCSRRQSVFAVPVRLSQLALLELPPVALLGLELEPVALEPLELDDGLLVLGLELEPAVLDGLLVLELGLELLELCATDTVAKPANAAAMAMPRAFFIMVRLLRSWKESCGRLAASAVPRRGSWLKSPGGRSSK